MYLCMLRAKLHNLTVTDTRLDYEGSLSVDAAILEAAGMVPYERIQVYNITNGTRFETYLIAAPAGSRSVVVNGAAARLAARGDRIIVAAYVWLPPQFQKGRLVRPPDGEPRVLIFNALNEIVAERGTKYWPFSPPSGL